MTGKPSGLSVTLPKALAELRKAVPPGAAIMVGFDRGGGDAQVFRHCPAAGRALGQLPAGAAGGPGHVPGHHHGHDRGRTRDIGLG